LIEIQTQWSIVDVQDANQALDIMEDLEAQINNPGPEVTQVKKPKSLS